MVLTFKEILRRAGARLSNVATSVAESNDIYPKLKDWCQERYERVYDSYPWKACLESKTMTIVASQEAYALDRDVGRLWCVYDQTNGISMRAMNVQDYIRLIAPDINQTGNVQIGDPTRFYEIGTFTVKAAIALTPEKVTVVSSSASDVTPSIVHIVGLVSGIEMYEDIVLTGVTGVDSSNTWDASQKLRISVGTSDGTRKAVVGAITVTGKVSTTVMSQISPYEIAPQYRWIQVSPKPKATGTQPTWLLWYNKRPQMLIGDNDIPIIDVGNALVEGIVSDGLREDGQINEANAEEQMFINMVTEKQSADGGVEVIEQFIPDSGDVIQTLDYGRVIGA